MRVVGWSRRLSGADYTPNGLVGAWAMVVVDGGVGVGSPVERYNVIHG